jgi:hypothetical protein
MSEPNHPNHEPRTRPARLPPDVEAPAEPIKNATVRGERAGALALLAFGAVPIVIGWIMLWISPEITLERFIAFSVIGIFAFAVIETFSVILLWGLGRLELPASFVNWLGAATIGEVAGMLYIIIRAVFGAKAP